MQTADQPRLLPRVAGNAVKDSVTAMVIGGTAGVGRAVVAALVARGYRVGVVARGSDRLNAVASQHAGHVAVAQADAGDATALDAAVESLIGDGRGVRVWINCAMATSFSPFGKVETDEFERILRTTFLGQVNGTRLALRHMDRGNIVNVGSGLAYRPVPLQSAYCAAKHAINGFTGSVRSELIAEGRPIALSLVQLPAINTPQFSWARNRLAQKPQPAPPVYAPEFAAKAVLRAIHTGAREVFAGRSVLKLVFTDMVVPGYLDARMSKDGITMQKSNRDEPGGRPDNLFAPIEHPAVAEGEFGDAAGEDGIIVDADFARKVAILGIVASAFLLGLILG